MATTQKQYENPRPQEVGQGINNERIHSDSDHWQKKTRTNEEDTLQSRI